MAGALFQLAQTVKGLPWLQVTDFQRIHQHNNYDYKDDIYSPIMDISIFSNTDLTMEVFDRSKVTFTYMFRDFRGATPVPAGWVGLIKTHCRRFETTLDNIAVNVTTYKIQGDYRWIYRRNLGPEHVQEKYPKYVADSRHEGAEVCESLSTACAFMILEVEGMC